MRRRSSVVGLLCSLLLGVAAQATVPNPAAAATGCDRPLVVGVRGSGENGQGYGETVRRAVDGFDANYSGDFRQISLDYPSEPVSTLIKPWRQGAYQDSMYTGIGNLRRLLEQMHSECPEQPWVLFGYSQGALVVHRALIEMDAANPFILSPHLAGVGLIADPLRKGRDEKIASSDSTASTKLDGIALAAHQYRHTLLPIWAQNVTESLCYENDPICAYSHGQAAREKFHQSIHDDYKEFGAFDVGARAARRLPSPPPTTGGLQLARSSGMGGFWTALSLPGCEGTSDFFVDGTWHLGDPIHAGHGRFWSHAGINGGFAASAVAVGAHTLRIDCPNGVSGTAQFEVIAPQPTLSLSKAALIPGESLNVTGQNCGSAAAGEAYHLQWALLDPADIPNPPSTTGHVAVADGSWPQFTVTRPTSSPPGTRTAYLSSVCQGTTSGVQYAVTAVELT